MRSCAEPGTTAAWLSAGIIVLNIMAGAFLGDSARLVSVREQGILDLVGLGTKGPVDFADISYPSGAALDGNGREQAHMGIAVGDYDVDLALADHMVVASGRSHRHVAAVAEQMRQFA